MKNIFKKIKQNKKLAMTTVSIAVFVTTILIGYIYISPKMQSDVLFDKNAILKDRWASLQIGDKIENSYHFVSDDSKLSSVLLTVQNADNKNSGTVKALIYDDNANILKEEELEIEPKTPSQGFKIFVNENNNDENVTIVLENISTNENIKTRITDSEDIDDIRLAYNIYSTMPDFVWKYVIIILIIVDIVIISGFYLVFIKKADHEKIFIAVIFLFGLCYFITFTPGNIPDETTHIRSTLGYSSILLSKGTEEDITIRECEQFIGDTQPSVKTLNSYRKMIIENDTSDTYIKTGETLASNAISYLPGIIIVTLCRLLSIGGILTIYLARVGNFVVYAFCAYFAIKKIPILKNALFVLSLLPMVIHQTISLSYDTIILSSAWLVIGYGFDFVYGSKKIKKIDMLVYMIASTILITQKTGIYFVLNLIPLLISKERINDKKERILTKVTLMIPWVTVMFGVPLLTKKSSVSNVSQKSIVSWANSESYSMSYFLSNIKETIILFVRTIVKKFDHYVFTTLGQYLGSLNLILTKNIFIIWLISLFGASLKTDRDDIDIPVIHKVIYIASFLAVCGASMLAMAFAFTPWGWPIIEGVQGRYFLPVLLLLVLVVRNRKIIINYNCNQYFIIFVILLQCVTIINILGKLLTV